MKKTISLITGVFVLLVAVGIAFASAEAEGGTTVQTGSVCSRRLSTLSF